MKKYPMLLSPGSIEKSRIEKTESSDYGMNQSDDGFVNDSD